MAEQERITVIEVWTGETRTRYILNADGTRTILDSEIISPRPFIKILNSRTPAELKAVSIDLEEYQ